MSCGPCIPAPVPSESFALTGASFLRNVFSVLRKKKTSAGQWQVNDREEHGAVISEDTLKLSQPCSALNCIVSL